jgi:hypothetical protein
MSINVKRHRELTVSRAGHHRAALAALLLLASAATAIPARAAEAGLDVALAVAADFSPVYPSRSFPAPVHELSAPFRLADGESYDALTATWIAVDVGDAAPPNLEIISTRLELRGQTAGRFRYEQPNPMPPGIYRLDVTADGRPWQSAEFEIVPAAEGLEALAPDEVLPLPPGRIWTYAFAQKAGEGARISLPDIEPDPDGTYRATATLIVADVQDGLAHIETRREDLLVLEEWWRLDAAGLHAVKRRPPEGEIALDPPQMLVALPLGPRSWDYAAADGSFNQTYRMWGPLPIEASTGSGSGYVVLTTQAMGPATITVERHFLPGVGMVREVIVQALQGNLLSRQELVLTGLDP